MKFSLRFLLGVVLVAALLACAYGYYVRANQPVDRWYAVASPWVDGKPEYFHVRTWPRDNRFSFLERSSSPPRVGAALNFADSELVLDNLVGNHDGKLSDFEKFVLVALSPVDR